MMELKTDKVLNGKHIALAVSDSETALLGRICWYTVCELVVPIEKVYELLEKNNIPKHLHPKEPRAVDCFKKAIQKVAQKHTEYIITEERIVDGEKIITNPNTRLLVSKDKNANENALPVIGVWEYDADREIIQPTLINQAYKEVFAEISNQVLYTYDILRNNFDEKNIRDMLRNILIKTYAISMRDKGSIYFVQNKYTDILVGIANVINSLSPYAVTTPSEMVTIPVIDTEEQRNLISYKFEQEIVSEVQNLLVEITGIIRDPNAQLLPCKYKQYAEKLKYLKEMADKYKQHLEIASEKVWTQIEVLQAQIVKLSDKLITP